MRNYLSLPAARAPDLPDIGNAFAHVGNALAGYRQGMNQETARNDELNQRAYQRGRDAKHDSRVPESDKRAKVEWLGKQALAADGITDPVARSAALQRILSAHPNADQLPPVYRDPAQAFKLIAADAGQWRDPTDQGKFYEMDGRIVQVSPSGSTREVYTAPEKPDPIRDMLLDRMRSRQGGAQQPAAPQQPQVLPQSNVGGNDPFLKLATDRAAPQIEGAPQQAAPDRIETPFGPMTRQEALDTAGAMLMSPKHAQAGKALMDMVNATGGEGLSRTAQGALDEKAIGMVDLAGRLDAIQGRFKPEYQTYDTGLKMYGLSWLDSIDALRGKIPPAERAKFEEYTAFRQDATNNLSEYIKYITGAAMGVQEEGRIRRGMPDPEKDSPSQFGAKLKNSIAQSKLALARYHYLRKNGYDDQTIQSLAKSDRLGASLSLQQMQGMINERLDDAAKEIKSSNPNLDDNAIRIQLKKIQREEFGI
jgi:hypothetical protein